MLTADGLAVQNDLRRVVALWLQEQRVHVRMTRNACCLGLNSLCTANLEAVGCGIGVERHVLRLEGGRLVAVLPENAAEGSSHHALAHIAARSGQHHRMQSLIHISISQSFLVARLTSHTSRKISSITSLWCPGMMMWWLPMGLVRKY